MVELAKPDLLDCETAGFVVGETEERLMLALNRQAVAGGEPMVGETIVIPKAAITAFGPFSPDPGALPENAVLLRRLDEWVEGDNPGPLIRWAAAHLRGCLEDEEKD